jgi:hypothetical protein
MMVCWQYRYPFVGKPMDSEKGLLSSIEDHLVDVKGELSKLCVLLSFV